MFLFTLFFVPFSLFQMFHFVFVFFISRHSGCSTLHYACSFQVIPDVPLCIIFVHFRSFWMFHFALCLFISGHCGCSTLHYFFSISGDSGCFTLHACSFQVISDVPLCIFFFSCQVILDVPLCIMLVHFRSFQMFHFALFFSISGHSGYSTLHCFCSFQIIPDLPLCIIFCSFQVIPDVPLCMWAIPESIRPHSG